MIRETLMYIKHLLNANNKSQIESDYLKNIYTSVIEDDRNFYAFELIEEIRNHLLKDTREITIKDFGAGSKSNIKGPKSISIIAKHALSSPYQCRVLFRLVEFVSPSNMLEIGTSLGISTIYMAYAYRSSKIYTLEGDPEIHNIANQLFAKLSLNNIQAIKGEFKETLKPTLDKIKKGNLDIAFIDGNHKKNATINYYQQVLPYLSDNGIIIIDDIYWSKEMTEAWSQIKNDSSIHCSIDLYFCGILFLNKALPKHISQKWKLGKKLYFLE